jgi:hypothetical protein
VQAFEDAFGREFVSSDEMALARMFRAMGISAKSEARGDTHARLTMVIASQ